MNKKGHSMKILQIKPTIYFKNNVREGGKIATREQIDEFYKETHGHQASVASKISKINQSLTKRAFEHDNSKFSASEADMFIKTTSRLKGSTYGSEEYKGFLAELKPALDHHCKINRHHPEHHKEGIKGMTLVDLTEMLCDWLASTERHDNGDIFRSIEINQKRFRLFSTNK